MFAPSRARKALQRPNTEVPRVVPLRAYGLARNRTYAKFEFFESSYFVGFQNPSKENIWCVVEPCQARSRFSFVLPPFGFRTTAGPNISILQCRSGLGLHELFLNRGIARKFSAQNSTMVTSGIFVIKTDAFLRPHRLQEHCIIGRKL